jgi:hypothetical protein
MEGWIYLFQYWGLNSGLEPLYQSTFLGSWLSFTDCSRKGGDWAAGRGISVVNEESTGLGSGPAGDCCGPVGVHLLHHPGVVLTPPSPPQAEKEDIVALPLTSSLEGHCKPSVSLLCVPLSSTPPPFPSHTVF